MKMHIMCGSFYSKKMVAEIPFDDLQFFAMENPAHLKLIGWTDEDIIAVREYSTRMVR